MVPLLIGMGCTAPKAEDAVVRVPLEVGATVLGVTRGEPDRPVPGTSNEAPTVAVDTSGGVWVAWTARWEDDEVIWLQDSQGLTREIAVAKLASNPRIAAGPDGSVWLTWVMGDEGRHVYLQRVDLRDTERQRISHDPWNAHPALVVGEDGPHLVWETASRTIVYFHEHTIGLGGLDVLRRRPDIALLPDGPIVAWDELQWTRGRVDPDYDLVVWRPGEKNEPQVLRRPGIQAAPDLLAQPDGSLLIACHDSESTGGIVKWLRLFRWDAGEWSSWEDPQASLEHTGENQGAEFPSIARTRDGGLVAVTRGAHGHQVHLLSASGASAPLDLTRSVWGARGWRQDVIVAGDTAYIARRARKENLVEVLKLPAVSGLPPFSPVEDLVDEGAPLPSKVPGVVFGDVHMHSALSDGTGPPDEILARAWARGLDFAVLTDHDTIVGSQLSPSDHDEIRVVTDWFDHLAGFTTLHGYEWTTPPTWREGSGHRNVYFSGADPTLHSAALGAPDTAALNAALAEEQAFTAPHHSSWTGTDWANFDPSIQRQFEIVSVHGLSEMPGDQVIGARWHEGGSYASDGLAAGLVFGFLGGSDGHGLRWHHGIGRVEDPWATGLTGARCSDPCGRGALWAEMYARRTWATSGARIVAELRIGEVGPGEETVADGEVSLTWTGTATLVRDGAVLGEFADGHVDRAPKGAHSYYIRIERDGHYAWTSPIFVEVR